jgi:hypothetical protein
MTRRIISSILLVVATSYVANAAEVVSSPFLGRSTSTVLANLGAFSKIFVSYHNCAWSPYYDNDDANDGNINNNDCNVASYNNNNDNNNNNAQLWYIGMTECLRANVAYTLYGVLKDENADAAAEDDAAVQCTQANYINTYVTTNGVETFMDSIEASGGNAFSVNANGQEITSDCQAVQQEQNNEGDANADVSYTHNQKINDKSTSTGLACSNLQSGDGTFVYNTFQSAYCDGRADIETTDTMDTFNAEMKNIQCFLIYDADTYNQNNQNENNNNNNNNNNNGGNGAQLDLLKQSDYCDIRELEGICPDPFGYLAESARERNQRVIRSAHPRRQKVKTAFSWILLSLGCLLLLGTVYSMYAKHHNSQVKQRSIFARQMSTEERTAKNQRDEEERARKQQLIEEMNAQRAKAKEEAAAAKIAAKKEKEAAKAAAANNSTSLFSSTTQRNDDTPRAPGLAGRLISKLRGK